VPFDLDELTKPHRTNWIALAAPLSGVEVLIQYASPNDSERFRRRLRQTGITKAGETEPTDGRWPDYLREFCKTFIKDWRGVTAKRGDAEDAPYDSDKMAEILGAVGSAFREIHEAIGREHDFFESAGNGST